MAVLVLVALYLACLEVGVDWVSARRVVGREMMKQSLACRPRLTRHLRSHEQYIRKHSWTIVQNTISGDFVRVDTRLWRVLQALNGECSLREWMTRYKDSHSPVVLLESVNQLHRKGFLLGMPVDELDLKAPAKSTFNPLMLKFSLVNPSRFLDGALRFTSSLSAKLAQRLIVLLLVVATLIAVFQGDRLSFEWHRLLSDPEQWWQYFLLYPCLKALHELSHAVVLRRLGGHVKEAGITLLVLMPIPYVDATDVWLLERRRDRLWVTAAGMLSDLTLASIAMILWYVLQPGLLTDVAFSVILMGTVSVLLFNANPLLKFDGYFLLEDILDSPGLARRSAIYWKYLIKRYLLSASAVLRPAVGRGERRWLLPYGLASLLYRVLLSVVIATFLINNFHELGVLLAAFCIVPIVIRPLFRLMAYLFQSTELSHVRLRAALNLSLFCLLTALLVLLMPLPSSTRAEGIVWVPEQAEVFSPEKGELIKWFVNDGDSVTEGQILAQLHAPELSMELLRVEAEIELLTISYEALRQDSPVHAMSHSIERQRQQFLAEQLRNRIDSLNIKASRAGRVAFAANRILSGYQVRQGQLLLYVVDEHSLLIRAVVDQRQLGEVQRGVMSSSVRLANDISTVVAARLIRQVPAGNNSLPSKALANRGFGGVDVVESGDGPLRTLEEVFHLELGLPPETHSPSGVGGRAFITLKHAPETLAVRCWRGSRRLFMKHLGG